MKVLVRQREPQPVLAQLRHHVGEGEGRERLELVHVQIEGSPVVAWRDKFVSIFEIDTLAPWTTALFWSVTVPLICPVVPCA